MEPRRKRKNRKRKTIWFNPPFCKSVKTNIARKFISLVKKHFNEKSPLKKILNPHSINISYSCMPNVDKIISAHNKKILKNKKEEIKPCNCRRKKECPLAESKYSCRTENVIYKAEVKSNNESKTYIGLTSSEFKKRVSSHKTDFNHVKYKESTKLSKYIWNLKEKNTKFEIKWNIVKKVNKIKNGDKMCRLCASEVNFILKNKNSPLNSRNELMNKCRHCSQFLLANWKKKQKEQ